MLAPRTEEETITLLIGKKLYTRYDFLRFSASIGAMYQKNRFPTWSETDENDIFFGNPYTIIQNKRWLLGVNPTVEFAFSNYIGLSFNTYLSYNFNEKIFQRNITAISVLFGILRKTK